MRGDRDYFYLIIINVSNRKTLMLEAFPPVARERNCYIASLKCWLAFWCLPMRSTALLLVCTCSMWCYCLTEFSFSLFSFFQCMRNPALLQRTGLVIRVLCHIQENVWLLRWMCRCWRHHGQLLGGTEPPSVCSDSACSPPKNPEAPFSLVLIRLLEPSRVPTETMKMRLVSLSFYRKINARSCCDAVW